MEIVILGGGFGGVRAALELERKIGRTATISLIDKNSTHLFTPALYQVASAPVKGRDPFSMALKKTIAIPFSEIFAGKNINFMQADIKSVDLSRQILRTGGGHTFRYDYLVFALGSQTNDFGIPGVKDYAYQYKTTDDALMIRKKIEQLLDAAAQDQLKLPLTALICGAGFTGIELAAEMVGRLKSAGRRRKLKMSKLFQIYIFEATPKILGIISDKERKTITERLTKLGIIIMSNSPIESVGQDFIKLKNGQSVKGDIVLWTAGIRPNALLGTVEGLGLSEGGRILTSEHLMLKNYKNVFAVGDNIEFIDPRSQKPIPAVAYLAVDQGRIAAKNIINSIREKELVIYKPRYDYWIAPIGGKYAMAHLGRGIDVTGFWGWLVREVVDFKYFVSILPLGRALSFFVREYLMFRGNDSQT